MLSKVNSVTEKDSHSRVVSLDEREVLKDERFQSALQQLAEEQHRRLGEVEVYARKCLAELSARPEDRYLNWIASLARFMYTRSFESEFDVNSEALEELKVLARTRPLVFLWSHQSHLDAFVFMRVLYDTNFRPQPLIFAGSNMNFAAFGALAKHSGAIFLRRSFKDDAVYKLVMKHFIDYLVSRHVSLSWSIEGTRSRTGVLMPPKLGLIQWVAESYHRASCDDALLVPVAISFDQIPEINDYIAMQHGLPKRKESLRWFIEYVKGMRAKFGKIYVRFAEPIALSESLPLSDAMSGGSVDHVQVQKLALEVCSRIEHVRPITPTDLVTMVLLAANGRGLDRNQIWGHAQAIADLIAQRQLPTAGKLPVKKPADLQPTLQALINTGLLKSFEKGAAAVYVITEGQELAAAYYRNTIVHYFLSSAMAEVGLAAAEDKFSEEMVLREAMAVRDLLKFEFSFKAKDAFCNDMSDYLDLRYPGWRVATAEEVFDKPPLFAQGTLRSFVEAYWILAKLLVSRGDKTVAEADEEALVEGCLDRGEELLIRKEIKTEAALSQPLFANAIKLARHRGLLRDDIGSLRERRGSFAAEMDRLLAGIDRLQQVYDGEGTGR
jgi:glycerol-3-phosphate O-acyltransferase